MSTDDPVAPAPKAAPETLALRAAPRPVTRLSRKAIAVLLGGAGLAVALAATWALKPHHDDGDAPQAQYSTERTTQAEGLAGLPKDYGGVAPPVLGPPLPGDLGGPILRAQQEGRMPTDEAAPPIGTPPGPSPEEQARVAERQRRLQEVQAAIASPLLAVGRQSQAEARVATNAGGATDQSAATAPAGAPAPSRRESFLTPTAADRATTSSARLEEPASPYTVMTGTTIPAALVTGLNSDLPGQVIASVTAPVYDSVSGQHLLIPQGARLLGIYDSETAYGEKRALLVWTRLIMPDGASIILDRMPATDQAGYAGVADAVNNHIGRLITGAALSTLLGVGAELAAPESQGTDGRVIIATRDGIQDSVNQVGQEITRRNLNIRPTITVRPGFPIRVLVNRDLVLRPYGRR